MVVLALQKRCVSAFSLYKRYSSDWNSLQKSHETISACDFPKKSSKTFGGQKKNIIIIIKHQKPKTKAPNLTSPSALRVLVFWDLRSAAPLRILSRRGQTGTLGLAVRCTALEGSKVTWKDGEKSGEVFGVWEVGLWHFFGCF